MVKTKRGGKRRVANEIIEGLGEFCEALEKGEPLADKFTIRKVVLDLEPQGYDPGAVKQLRKWFSVSQAIFAKMLGTSVDTIRAWEQGNRKPSSMACRLMEEVSQNRDRWREKLRNSVREPTSA